MPIFGIFFVPLHHQSDRKTMFKKTAPNPQLDMFTAGHKGQVLDS
jgi:hypothetical protein